MFSCVVVLRTWLRTSAKSNALILSVLNDFGIMEERSRRSG